MENLLCCVIWAWCFFVCKLSERFSGNIAVLKHLSCFAVVFLYSHKSSGMSCFLNYSLVRFLCCWCYFHIFLILIIFLNVPFCRNVISETYFWFCCYVTCTGHVVSWMCFLKWNLEWHCDFVKKKECFTDFCLGAVRWFLFSPFCLPEMSFCRFLLKAFPSTS